MAAAEQPVECGYCLEQEEQMVDPRTLPCRHTHCLPCLLISFETSRLIKCGKCKQVFDVTLTRLPPVTRPGSDSIPCSTCKDKGKTEEPAVSYCSECNRTMCAKHEESHGDFFPLHEDMIKIEDYRSCSRHDDRPIRMGCSTCFQVLCSSCSDEPSECGGVKHSPVSLEELVKLLKVQRDKVKVKAQIREGQLSTLLKRSTKVLSDYERKTEELIKKLHQTRDEQLADLQRKYDELEKELVRNRRISKEQLVEYMESELGEKLRAINTLVLLQDGRFEDSHQVDLARSFTPTSSELLRNSEEDLPSFRLSNQKTLSHRVTEREIELKMVDAAVIPVSPLPPPTSLRLHKMVDNVGPCCLVCHYDGVTYVGGEGTALYKIDDSDSSVSSLLSIEGIDGIAGLCVYNEKLYILGDPCKVIVTDLNGKQITSWVHSDQSECVNKLVVVGGHVVVPDMSNKRLTVYSLDGQTIKYISCPGDGEWTIMAICAPDQDSVVVSSFNTSTVFRVNIETGEMIWTSNAVAVPGGVACYAEEYILVARWWSEQTEIHILQADTGKHVGKLVDTEKRYRSAISDLCVARDQLIVPHYYEESLLYYQLMVE